MPRRNPRPITLMFYDDGSRTRPISHRLLRVTRDDSAGFERSNEEYSPLLKGTDEAPSNGNAKPMPDGKPSTTTTGGTAFSGMKQTLVAAYPLEGKFAYWPQTTPEGQIIWRRDLQSKSEPERVSGPHKVGAGEFLWSDINTTHFRLWKTTSPSLVMSDATSRRAGSADGIADGRVQEQIRNALEAAVPLQQSLMHFGDPRLNSQLFERQLQTGSDGTAGARDGAMGVSSHNWENGGKDADTGSEAASGGVGAESWIGGRKNTTGYRITAGDAARPGLAIGRNNATQVARRISVLEQINSMNRRAWS